MYTSIEQKSQLVSVIRNLQTHIYYGADRQLNLKMADCLNALVSLKKKQPIIRHFWYYLLISTCKISFVMFLYAVFSLGSLVA